MTPVQKMAWVTPNTPLNECVVVMSDRRVRHLPVFTGNPADADTKLVGLVSIRDVLASVWGDKFGEKEEDEDDL
jgi:CBS domain-containing protein